MAVVLLVDGNPLIWRAAYAGYGVRGNSSIASGVLGYFYEMIHKFQPRDLVVCWDKGLSRWRSEICESYKATRMQKKRESDLDLEMVQEQSGYVRRYLEALGVRQVLISGVEADDVLSWLSEYYLKLVGGLAEGKVVISTGDHDLWQLVRDKIVVWDQQKEALIDEAAVQQALGVPPGLVADLKSLMGDASDNLPGVKGIGQKTAAKLLEAHGNLGALLDHDPEMLKELGKRVATARILDADDLLGEMYRLVKLPTMPEAVHCLTPVEFGNLDYQLTQPLQRDEFRLRVMAERIGKSCATSEPMVPLATTDLSGMVRDMEAYKNQETTWTDLREVDWAVMGCNRCPLRADTGQQGPTLPAGHSGADIMLLGRNPGQQELENGVPFWSAAPAGGRLDKFLEVVGLTRAECWITNACKCYSEANRTPTWSEVMACSQYLRAEIDLVKPKLIICFGNEAMSLVTPYKSRVTKHCGEILDRPESVIGRIDAKVAISVHPSAACRGGQGESNMKYAETQIKALLDKVTQ